MGELKRPAGDEQFLAEPEFVVAAARVAAIGREPSLGTRQAIAAATSGVDAPEQLGQYRLLAELGAGGMGTVYKALHTQLEKIVALKVLPAQRLKDPQAVTRFSAR